LGEVTGHVASGSNPVQYCTAKANHEVLMMNTGWHTCEAQSRQHKLRPKVGFNTANWQQYN
jgi:hypothetical protein